VLPVAIKRAEALVLAQGAPAALQKLDHEASLFLAKFPVPHPQPLTFTEHLFYSYFIQERRQH
jgi:hypothetical protein